MRRGAPDGLVHALGPSWRLLSASADLYQIRERLSGHCSTRVENHKGFCSRTGTPLGSSHALAATTSTSTLNSSRVKPDTIIKVEAGGGSATAASRAFI